MMTCGGCRVAHVSPFCLPGHAPVYVRRCGFGIKRERPVCMCVVVERVERNKGQTKPGWTRRKKRRAWIRDRSVEVGLGGQPPCRAGPCVSSSLAFLTI